MLADLGSSSDLNFSTHVTENLANFLCLPDLICTGWISADAAGGLIGRKFGPKEEKFKMRAPCAKEHAF